MPANNNNKGDDDTALWSAITRGVRPLRKRPPVPIAAPPPPSKKQPTAKTTVPAAKPKPPPAPPPEPDLTVGGMAGVDKRTVQRLKRGQLAPQAKLDLHHHTQYQAHAALSAFIAECQAMDLRCVLVVTGKGRAGEDGGVLRAQVPRWLNQPPNRARVLAVAQAQPKHGGAGALYVLLRKGR